MLKNDVLLLKSRTGKVEDVKLLLMYETFHRRLFSAIHGEFVDRFVQS